MFLIKKRRLNLLVDSFPYKYMLCLFMITNLIELRIGKLILNHFIKNNCPEFPNGILDSYFFQIDIKK